MVSHAELLSYMCVLFQVYMSAVLLTSCLSDKWFIDVSPEEHIKGLLLFSVLFAPQMKSIGAHVICSMQVRSCNIQCSSKGAKDQFTNTRTGATDELRKR